ncbi:MAG: hypothetical protein SFX73_09020 [Kofleriaceae bacterium]|nr:hypothetical protein [Kofleriaceae bacterium]
MVHALGVRWLRTKPSAYVLQRTRAMSNSSAFARVAFIWIVAVSSGCAGDESPVGGWSGQGLYACLLADGRGNVEDNKTKAVEELDGCRWDDSGRITCGSDGWTWTIDDGNLALTIAGACSQDPANESFCGPYVLRTDSSLGCPE